MTMERKQQGVSRSPDRLPSHLPDVAFLLLAAYYFPAMLSCLFVGTDGPLVGIPLSLFRMLLTSETEYDMHQLRHAAQ